jgi:putative ABC transport system permease protein
MIARWACMSLLHRPGSLVGSVAALASAFVLVLLFEGIWQGESEKTADYPRKVEADVWVAQRGIKNMHMAASFIPESRRDQVAAVEGVVSVDPILYFSMLLEAGTRLSFCYIVGLPEGARKGGPWSMAEGKPIPAPGEAVLPDLLARMGGVRLGDTVRIADKSLRVVGLSRETYSMVNPLTFIHASDMADLLSLQGYDSYLAVKAGPGMDPSALAARIEKEVDGVSALARTDFVANDVRMSMQMGVELIGLITGIGGALAALILAFVLYTQAWQGRRDMAILKAVGFRSLHLLGGILLQAFLVGSLGFLAAVGLAYAAAALIAAAVPQVAVSLTSPLFAKTAMTAAGVAALAVIVPWRQAARVDPHSVFQ